MRRRAPAPGLRPRGRFAAGVCPVCGAGFVLDRQVQPWARARTCSDGCRARLGNRGRNEVSCEHCVMVAGYRDERGRQLVAVEDGGFRDERAASRVVVFGVWLQVYEWPSAEAARWSDRVA